MTNTKNMTKYDKYDRVAALPIGKFAYASYLVRRHLATKNGTYTWKEMQRLKFPV